MSFIWIKTLNYLSRVLVLCGDWGSPEKRIFLALSPVFPIFHPFSLQTWCSPLHFGVPLSILVSWSSKMLQATQNAALKWICFVRCCLECSQPQKLLQLGVIWGFLGIFLLFLTFLWSCAQAQLMGIFHALLCPLLVFTGIEEVLRVILLCFVSYFIFILLFNAFVNIVFCYGASLFFPFYYFTWRFLFYSLKSVPKNSHSAFCLDLPSHLSLQPSYPSTYSSAVTTWKGF